MRVLIGTDPVFVDNYPKFDMPFETVALIFNLGSAAISIINAGLALTRACKRRTSFTSQVAIYTTLLAGVMMTNVLYAYLYKNLLTSYIFALFSLFTYYVFVLTQTQTLRIVILPGAQLEKILRRWNIVHTIVYVATCFPYFVAPLLNILESPSSYRDFFNSITRIYIGWVIYFGIYDISSCIWVSRRIYEHSNSYSESMKQPDSEYSSDPDNAHVSEMEQGSAKSSSTAITENLSSIQIRRQFIKSGIYITAMLIFQIFNLASLVLVFFIPPPTSSVEARARNVWIQIGSSMSGLNGFAANMFYDVLVAIYTARRVTR